MSPISFYSSCSFFSHSPERVSYDFSSLLTDIFENNTSPPYIPRKPASSHHLNIFVFCFATGVAARNKVGENLL